MVYLNNVMHASMRFEQLRSKYLQLVANGNASELARVQQDNTSLSVVALESEKHSILLKSEREEEKTPLQQIKPIYQQQQQQQLDLHHEDASGIAGKMDMHSWVSIAAVHVSHR